VLKLKRVELQGFKSFYDRSEMRFSGHGIAAVVGPNGCGKSNLADAISWVLGEQSAKSLRGTRMEDVIFAGTRQRKPLGMAQVTITLVDPKAHEIHYDQAPKTNGHAANGGVNGHAEPNGHSGANGHGANGKANGHATLETAAADVLEKNAGKAEEITISRRLYRSGESEYLINGRTARLRDIQDIFMGTGLGPESYAIIEQGRIGQILSTKPQDRRSVIEEAAGVTKFKTRRRLAEAKLEGAKQNLTRVFDILEEVGRQCNSLKRQASKAKRYEELHTEMVAHLRQALTGRYRMLEREAARTALDLSAANQNHQALAQDVAGKDAEHTALLEHLYASEARLTESRRQLSEKKIDAERTRGRLESQARQIAGIEQRLGQGEAESLEVEARVKRLSGELDTHARSLAESEEHTEVARQRLAAKSREREQLQGALQDRERGLEALRQGVLRLLGEAATLRNQLAQVDSYLASIARDTARLAKDEETAAADLERFNAVKREISEKLGAGQLALESTTEQRRAVEGDLANERNRAGETRKALETARAELSRLKARRDSLQEVISHRSYTTESVKRLFTAVEKGQTAGLKPAGVLADFVDVDPAYEKATEEFLHDELEYVVVKHWGEAESGIDLMRGNLDGRATFLVHPEPGDPVRSNPVPEPAIGPETGILARLKDVLRLTNGLTNAPADLLPRLARCFLVEDRATAQRLSLQYPDVYFLLADGVCYHGHAVSGGKKTGAGPLALKRELREVSAQVRGRQNEADQKAALLESIERQIALLSEEQERLRGLQQMQEKAALALDHDMRKLGEDLSRANSRLSVARLELGRLEKERARSAEQQERNRTLVEEKEAGRQQQEAALEQARAHLTAAQAEFHKLGEEHAALREEMAKLEERRRSERAAQARLETQAREFAARRQQVANEMERLGVDRARLLADNIELDTRGAKLAEEIATLDEEVARLAELEAGQRTAIIALDESLKVLRAAVAEAQEKRSEYELELVRKQSELKYLHETCRKELATSLDELAQAQEIVADEAALEEAERRYQEVKARIDALGPVNPQALEEFREAQQRYDFLNAQRTDLLDSIRDTEKAIQDIEVESRKRFGDAFVKINEHFKGMFQTLFGGGTGEMRLTDESNLSESGIEIVASPPGKKLQNVLLLSGGEKSLTAMALLMAIFRFQPSPFCILDEVDAPLDEPNIMRLTKLVEEMSRQTQFIVITHAKRTMEAAQALYGVTMQELGVSKLVSVRFSEPPPPPPPQVMAMPAATM
jgi:chromosome segregation protein